MKALTIFKERQPKPVKLPKTKNPWLLETVENGLRATNVKEMQDGIREDKGIPVKYFEYDRLYGTGAFTAPLKVMEMFGELQSITPRTIGYIFGDHKYLYATGGILRRNWKTKKEAFYSDETLRNENIACYMNLTYAKEETTILKAIEEATEVLDNATNTDRPRIQDKDTEQQDN
jgi:hypothetical protein